MQQPSVIDPSSRLQALTREYSRYSRSAGGLSAMAGGMACLASFLAGALLPTTLGLRVVLIAMPVLWIVGKQWLAHRYYQRLGQVEEQVTSTERNFQRFFIAFTALVSVLVTGSVLIQLAPMGELPWDLRAIGYLAVVVLLPWVVWRWLRTPLEFIVGVFLLCQAALAFTGQTYGFDPSTAVFPMASIALIVVGWRDHQRFQRLQVEMRAFMAGRSSVE
ncbi:TPA: hypothetical protein UMB92_003028 [Stenotrophomonas maltophilia]|nr:hypothetical protein [Stenotrophomonas maltophilia]